MGRKTNLVLAAYAVGSLALGTEAYAQQRPDTTRANSRTALSYDSAMARIRARRLSYDSAMVRAGTGRDSLNRNQQGQDTTRTKSPFGYYCFTQKDAICPTIRPRTTAADSPRTRADSLSQDSTARARRPRTTRRQGDYNIEAGSLTTAGNGIFATSYRHPLDINNDLVLDSLFHAQQYRFIDARRGLDSRIRAMGPDSTLDRRDRALRNYLLGLLRNTQTSDTASLRILNQAARNGIISPLELRDANGRLLIRPGAYIVEGINRDSTGRTIIASNPAILYVRQTEADSIIRENARIAGRERQIADSTARARIQATRDSTARARTERETQIADSTDRARGQPAVKQHDKTPGFRAGLESQFGTNEELTLGAFADARVIPGIRLGLFADYSIPSLRGELYISQISADTTQRATQLIGQLIGPGTYETRTDYVTTHANEEARAEAGASLILTPSKYFEIFGTAGAKLLKRDETIDGRSTIETERNGLPMQSSEIITGTRENSSYTTRPSFGAGIRINPIRRISLEGSFNRTGNQNRGKAGVRFNF